jgi:TPR repeat protein
MKKKGNYKGYLEISKIYSNNNLNLYKSIKYLKKSIDITNNPNECYYQYAMIYFKQFEITNEIINLKNAKKMFLKMISNDEYDPIPYYEIYLMYRYENGYNRDEEKEVHYLSIAAGLNHSPSIELLNSYKK